MNVDDFLRSIIGVLKLTVLLGLICYDPIDVKCQLRSQLVQVHVLSLWWQVLDFDCEVRKRHELVLSISAFSLYESVQHRCVHDEPQTDCNVKDHHQCCKVSSINLDVS